MSLLKVCMTFYFHATVAAMFLFTWAYSISYLHHVLPDMGTYGGPWKFLTYINLVSIISTIIIIIIIILTITIRGAKQWGLGGSQPPLNFGWGVEH